MSEAPVVDTGGAGGAGGARPMRWLIPLLPAVLYVVIVAVDFGTPDEFRTDTMLCLVPMTASSLSSVRATVVYAVLATLTFLVLDPWLAPTGYEHDWAGFVVVVLGGAIAVAAVLLRTRLQERVSRLGNVVEHVQRALLPPAPPVVGGIRVARSYLAAERDAEVGGDVYDVVATPYGTRAFIADVQGKGLTAVGASAALVGTFSEAAFTTSDLWQVGRRMGEGLERFGRNQVLLGEPDTDWFATALIAQFGPDGLVELVNYGHEPPALIGPSGVRWLDVATELPLGLAGLIPGDERASAYRFRMTPDESLLLYTDGTTEARDAQGRFFPLREWIAANADPNLPANELLTRLQRALLAHVDDRLTDDAALMVLRPDVPKVVGRSR
ncbi:serine/threonine-protein phosphatase (plasmid) [Embleya sp. NBC_00888]|uniref:PP2C family protein-serine/threonine phosphatase n=1 Tax=Embleya sp. NBC_00888 TaxID=2975960 RepID=UPI002F91066D|nr:serine/threonine-protein phosphatase [Embleya sp. NBC_00888]